MANRRKIVITDDDPIILKLTRNTLMDAYDVFTVPDALKLFQLLERCVPDLILLDVLMPGMSGYEAIRILKQDERTCDIPVVFLTSRSDVDSEIEGLNLGAADYLSKPFSPYLLLKRVEMQVQLERQKRELKDLNENLRHIVEQKVGTILKLQRSVIRTVSDLVECRDDVTGTHVARTEHVLRLLCEEMLAKNVYRNVIQTWDLNLFLQSAQLHDVGKIAVRDSILLKKGKLTAEEFDEMKKHTTFGEQVIEKIQRETEESAFLTHARIMAGTHHERWDGSGYPKGIAGPEIPLQGRLMALSDVYDALVSVRPYKPALPHDHAVRIISEESGRQFDPLLTQVFVAASDRFADKGQVA
ncbi:MAG: response regulator [Desulfovibrio sp.]|jgi:putative two-component system response regulator|nr:response regulator [Desulfovibrio sp.]